MKKLTKKDIAKYKICEANVIKMTGVKADVYVFTISQLNELLKLTISKELVTIRKKMLDLEDEYGFQVPYDGSNEFYDKERMKHYKKGYEDLIKIINP